MEVQTVARARRRFYFFFNDTPTPEIYTLSLHDALPIYRRRRPGRDAARAHDAAARHATLHVPAAHRSEEHTSELQSRFDLVCRLLLEKKKGQSCRSESVSLPTGL